MALGIMRRLFTVHDSFEVPGRGKVIVARSKDADAKLIIGDSFTLALATGERFAITALGVEQFTKCFSEATQLGILIGEQISISGSLSGSEIWIEV